MSFLEQPSDVIIYEYLVDLPINELLSICQVSVDINTLCHQNVLWETRIAKEFPDVNITNIENPRSWYLRQVLFGGEVYLHDETTQKAEYETIVYQDLFGQMEATAKKYQPPNKEYIIVYSADKLDIIAIQTKDWTIIQPGPTRKITLVDIIYVSKHEKIWRDLNTHHYYITKYPLPANTNIKREYKPVKDFLFDKHANAYTDFYQYLIKR